MAVAARRRPLSWERLPSREVVLPAVLLLVLLGASLALRTRALGASLWMDEGLSIGISSHSLLDIPGILRQDGSPPLYYMLLSLWMDFFGSGPADTQGLSLAISLLAVPGGLWAGWSLFGRRAGYIGAALGAANPFLTVYAQEARMYSLMVILSLLLTAAFLHVFAFRRARYLPLFVVVLTAMLYTHNWGLFVTAGALCALLYCAIAAEDRRTLVRDAAIGFGAAGLLYVPWLPTLAYQIKHTGAPWLNPPRFGAPVQIAKHLLGGGGPSAALVLAGGSGIAAIFQSREDQRERTAVIAAFILCVATLAVAWVFSQVSPAWTTRYLGVAVGPIIILASAGLSRAGNLGLAALAIVLAVWFIPRTYDLRNKSNAAELGSAVSGQLRPGDLVVSLHPEQTPLIDYHFRNGLRYATELGPTPDPRLMDWRDVKERLDRATPDRNLAPLLDRLPRGARVVLVHPITSDRDDWDAPWTSLVRRRSAQWGRAVSMDRRFRLIAAVPGYYRYFTRIGVRGVLYEKTGA